LFLGPTSLGLLVPIIVLNGVFTLGQYTWMPVWLPELYPTRLRAGAIITHLGGYGTAATTFGCIYLVGIAACFFCPETKGRPLPS
jgi:hypothetical protein